MAWPDNDIATIAALYNALAHLISVQEALAALLHINALVLVFAVAYIGLDRIRDHQFPDLFTDSSPENDDRLQWEGLANTKILHQRTWAVRFTNSDTGKFRKLFIIWWRDHQAMSAARVLCDAAGEQFECKGILNKFTHFFCKLRHIPLYRSVKRGLDRAFMTAVSICAVALFIITSYVSIFHESKLRIIWVEHIYAPFLVLIAMLVAMIFLVIVYSFLLKLPNRITKLNDIVSKHLFDLEGELKAEVNDIRSSLNDGP